MKIGIYTAIVFASILAFMFGKISVGSLIFWIVSPLVLGLIILIVLVFLAGLGRYLEEQEKGKIDQSKGED